MEPRGQLGGKTQASLGVLCVAIALAWSSATKAETRVYLLRGWFGVFSTGLDTLATELRGKGIKAETAGHLAWKTTVSDIVKWHATSDTGPLVLVGHSQGANNVIDMARLLQRENISVDLLVTLAPAMQDPIPDNVVRAINYYNSPGWGAPITADAGYRGELRNINLGGDIGLYHMAIDKNPTVQAEIEHAILALRQPQAQAEAQAR
jgi:pimeloyl-ACP methyl ester carboxylesterase